MYLQRPGNLKAIKQLKKHRQGIMAKAEGNVNKKTFEQESGPNGSLTDSPDIPAIMARIRKQVKTDYKSRDQLPDFKSRVVDINAGASRKAGELLNSEELRYLNANYNYAPRLNLDQITSHRPGLIGKVIVKSKRKLLSIMWDVFKDYFSAEREYQANLVRYLNDVSKYVDSRDASNFWELVRKIDVDVSRALERIERINDELSASVYNRNQELSDKLEAISETTLVRKSEIETRLKTLDSVGKGLESIVANLSRDFSESERSGAFNAHTEGRSQPAVPDYSYLLLENRFRGSEEDIAKRVSIYPPIFEASNHPILEIGSGRGELQALFKQNNISSYGVDIDQAMVKSASQKGLDVRHGDGLKHLSEVADRSLGGLIAIQVVEHLQREQLETLFKLCTHKIEKGGRVVFETIDPRSIVALSSNYFRDPTHVWPLHPETLEYAMTLAGLRVIEIKRLSPVPAEALLKEIPIQPHTAPSLANAVALINQNFRQVNELLYGYQDYCIIAEVA